MTYFFVLIMIFCVVFVQAETVQPKKSLCQVVNEIARTDDDIFTFAKLTLEEERSEPGLCSQLLLPLSVNTFKSDNKIEMVGKYLNTKTDEEMRRLIQDNRAGEGIVLLEDFFDTIIYKELRKKLEKCIYMMISCNFLTPEESKMLRDLKIFYPDDYKASLFTWEILREKHKINALSGQLHKVIGLKKNRNEPLSRGDTFGVAIDIEYKCSLRQIEKRALQPKEDAIANFHPYRDVYIEPRHNIYITITFIRNKNLNFNSAVFTFQALGGERIFAAVEKIDTSWLGPLSDFTPREYDVQNSALNPFFYGECRISSSWDFFSYPDWLPQFSDFIIKIDEKEDSITKLLSHYYISKHDLRDNVLKSSF